MKFRQDDVQNFFISDTKPSLKEKKPPAPFAKWRDAEDADGETPLHYAALAGQIDAVRALLRHRADPSIESAELRCRRIPRRHQKDDELTSYSSKF